jgi:hypothetical protein
MRATVSASTALEHSVSSIRHVSGSRKQAGGHLLRKTSNHACRKQSWSSLHVVQTLLRWPAHERIQQALAGIAERARTDSERVEKTRRTVAERARQDIDIVKAAPISQYSDVWTFPVCLISYSTMLVSWATELAGVHRLISGSGVGHVVPSMYLALRADVHTIRQMCNYGTAVLDETVVRTFKGAIYPADR